MLHSWEDSHLDLTYKGPLSFRNRLLLQEAVTLLTFGWDCQLRKGVFPHIWYIMLFYGIQFHCTVLHAIAFLASARGLCLARRLYNILIYMGSSAQDGENEQYLSLFFNF